ILLGWVNREVSNRSKTLGRRRGPGGRCKSRQCPLRRRCRSPHFICAHISSPLSADGRWTLLTRLRLADARLKCHINDALGHSRRRSPMQRIGFIVSPGFQVMSCAVIAAFELANREMDEPVYDVRLLSETGGYIRASIGMSVATHPFGRANYDTLIMGGSTEPPTPGLIKFVRHGVRRCRL